MALNTAQTPTDACSRGLAGYLRTAIPGLTVYEEWPEANQKLTYPTLSLFQGKSNVMNLPPETIDVTAPDVNNQVVATEIVGEVDFQMQLDLWCSDKVMRKKYAQLVIDAINAQAVDASGLNNPAGLSLQLADYFNEWVRFDVDSYETVDDEAGAQRRERRTKIMLLVNCRAIRQRTYYAMKTIQTYVGASPTVGLTDDAMDTEIIQVVP